MTNEEETRYLNEAGFAVNGGTYDSSSSKGQGSGKNSDEQLTNKQLNEAGFSGNQEKVEGGSFIGGVQEFFSGNKREAQYNPNNFPEFGEVVDQLSPLDWTKLPTKAALSTTFDPKVEQEIIQDRFPDAKFTDVGNGYMQIDHDGKQYVLNKAGVSKSDLESTAATMLGFGGAAKAVDRFNKTGSTGIRILRQMLGQGGTEAALQGNQMLLGRERFDPVDVGLATFGGAASEALTSAQKAYQRSKDTSSGVQDFYDNVTKQNVAVADEATSNTGVPLYQAQKTTSAADINKQQFALGQGQGAEVVESALKTQDQASENAVQNLLDKLAPPSATETGEQGIVNASKDLITRAKNNRTLESSPLYERAKAENVDIDIEPINDIIISIFNDMPTSGKPFRDIVGVQELILGSVKTGTEVGSFNKLLRAKKTLSGMLDNFGDTALDLQSKSDVRRINDALEDELLKSSDTYRMAKETHILASPDVKRLEDSLVGDFAKYEVEDLYKIADKVFGQNQNLTNIGQVKRIKADIISVAGGKKAWNEILRVNFERGLNRAADNVGSTNVPINLHKAIFGKTNQTKEIIMEAAKGTPIEGNLRWLDISLKRAGLGRTAGSPTAKYESIKKDLSGILRPIFDGVKDVTTRALATGGASLGKDAGGQASKSTYQKNLQNLVEVMFNPKWTTRLNTIKKLDSNGKKAEGLMRTLLGELDKMDNKALITYQLNNKRDKE